MKKINNIIILLIMFFCFYSSVLGMEKENVDEFQVFYLCDQVSPELMKEYINSEQTPKVYNIATYVNDFLIFTPNKATLQQAYEASIIMRKADSLHTLKKLELSKKLYLEAIELNSKDPLLIMSLGVNYYSLGKTDSACYFLNLAIDQCTGNYNQYDRIHENYNLANCSDLKESYSLQRIERIVEYLVNTHINIISSYDTTSIGKIRNYFNVLKSNESGIYSAIITETSYILKKMLIDQEQHEIELDQRNWSLGNILAMVSVFPCDSIKQVRDFYKESYWGNYETLIGSTKEIGYNIFQNKPFDFIHCIFYWGKNYKGLALTIIRFDRSLGEAQLQVIVIESDLLQ